MPDLAMAASKHPLFARVLPERYASTGAFGPLEVGPSRFPGLDAYVETVTANHLFNREQLELYGNLHFGDVARGEWEVAEDLDLSTWGNNYYDCVLTAARLFARTGDPRFLDLMAPMASHFLETACFNTDDPDDWLSGFSPAYGEHHRGTGHFEQHYAEGIWAYHYLTGDERAREVGLRGAESIVERQPWGNENVNCRTAYQRGSTCIEAYKATRDARYIQHAKHLLVDMILATQDRYGRIGWVDAERGKIKGEQSFMMALYADTLWKYLKEAPDAAASAKLARLADFLDRYARKKPGREAYWNQFPRPNDRRKPEPVPGQPEPTVYWNSHGLIAGVYACAYDLTGNGKYLLLAQNCLADMWNSQSKDKRSCHT